MGRLFSLQPKPFSPSSPRAGPAAFPQHLAIRLLLVHFSKDSRCLSLPACSGSESRSPPCLPAARQALQTEMGDRAELGRVPHESSLHVF